MSTESTQCTKQILGYTLKERIGTGGYGEVWSAEAPGGFAKAVKLVYGFHDEKRAQTELKAMDRIKEVRHPFLLSLERIEVHEGQLVVVSELADKSLADLFDEYTKAGEPGIPREELLQYMRDAAEGLDYLSETHKLQHLDVKPENLLIVSGHVKVADFGLVKDLQDASQSLMTGMTPAYAAPELFDGQPCGNSDQYSLAIVYQEMLTAVRPFPGSTPAQLAAQHMHGRPHLRPLPKGDQVVIAKALSKDPSVRFPNCRAMVDELLNRKLHRKRAIRRVTTIQQIDDAGNVSVADRVGRDITSVMSDSALPFKAVEISTLDPPACDANKAEFRPTLILSVGNTANRAAQKIKERLVLRHNSMDDLPAVQIRSFDSDRNEITKLTLKSDQGTLTNEETVELPLQKPENYRDKAKSKFGWLPRRWIYNIPRSLQTEGLRPLGRLAFADHFTKICDSIQEAIENISKAENIATTADTIGINPSEKVRPRVFIISSISGGLGSGMTLDLAYTVKTLLAERGLPIDSVHGILLHATNQRSRDAGLSSANAFTFLTELRHYNDYGYPGDPSLGLPEFHDEPPLDEIYYLDLGLDLSQTHFENELEKLAEYVYLNSVSKCSVFFDECRKLDDESEEFSLRTFGISVCGPSIHSSQGIGNSLAKELISKWSRGSTQPDAQDEAFAENWFNKYELHFDGVSNSYADQFDQILDDAKMTELSKQVRIIANSDSKNRADELEFFLDKQFGAPRARKDSGHVDSPICEMFDQFVSHDATTVGACSADIAMNLLETEQLDLVKPLRLIAALKKRLDALQDRFDEETRCCNEQLAKLTNAVKDISPQQSKAKSDKAEMVVHCADAYLQFRIQEFILRYSKEFCRTVGGSLASTRTILEKFQNQLELIASEFDGDGIIDQKKQDELNMEQLMLDSILEDRTQLICRAEKHVFDALVSTSGGFIDLLNEPTLWRKHLPAAIRMAMQCVLADAFKKISLDRIVANNQIGVDQLVKWLNEKLNHARPTVSQCGGGSRALVGLPQHSESTVLVPVIKNQFCFNSAQVNGTCGELVFCFEGEDISLANVAFRLLEQQPDASQLAKRIHTRNDIEWTTLDDLL